MKVVLSGGPADLEEHIIPDTLQVFDVPLRPKFTLDVDTPSTPGYGRASYQWSDRVLQCGCRVFTWKGNAR